MKKDMYRVVCLPECICVQRILIHPAQYVHIIEIPHAGVGGHKVSFPKAVSAGDDVALLATTRECTKNDETFTKKGFYQYSAAWDSKHNVTLEDGKSARVLYTIQQMQDGVKR